MCGRPGTRILQKASLIGQQQSIKLCWILHYSTTGLVSLAGQLSKFCEPKRKFGLFLILRLNRDSARTRVRLPSQRTMVQGVPAFGWPVALPSTASSTFFFYCFPKNESSQSFSCSPYPLPPLPNHYPANLSPLHNILGVPSYNF